MLWLEEQKEALPRLEPRPVLAVNDHCIPGKEEPTSDITFTVQYKPM